MHDYLKSGRQAIRLLYFLIIGLSITKAIEGIFGSGVPFLQIPFEHVMLFVVFFSFVSRFFLGAYRVLSYDVEIEVRRGKIVLDILVLLCQALAFYVFSLNYADAASAQIIIIVICGIGIVWVAWLYLLQITEEAFRVWLALNVFMIIFVWVYWTWVNYVPVLLGVSVAVAVADYWFNGDFFFSLKHGAALRIFVAGPYGDEDPDDTTQENVEQAKRIGKELALKGHYPFVPHTMLHGWETDKRFTLEDFKAIDFAWLEFCDALYFIAESPGANVEKELATQRGLQIFTELEQIPDAKKKRPRKSRLE